MSEDMPELRGHYIGGRDLVPYGRNIYDSSTQLVTVRDEKGQLEDYMWAGRWNICQPGYEITAEIEVLELRNRKNEIFTSRRIVRGKKRDSSTLTRDMIDFKPLESMQTMKAVANLFGDHYPVVALKGEVRGVYRRRRWPTDQENFNTRNFRAPEPPKFWEYMQNLGHPTCTVVLWGNQQLAYCHFGPYTSARPYVQLEGWDFNAAPSLHDLGLNIKGAKVGVVGSASGKVGHILATAIFDLEVLD